MESPVLGLIFDIFHNFSEKLEKQIFRPGNHEIGNTAKFWRDGKKRISDSDSATQNCMETSGFVSGQKVELILLTCVIIVEINCNFFFIWNNVLPLKIHIKPQKLARLAVMQT